MTAFDRELTRYPRIYDNVRAAVEYALSAYWVEPIQMSDEYKDLAFRRQVRAADWAVSGMIHFTPNPAAKPGRR